MVSDTGADNAFEDETRLFHARLWDKNSACEDEERHMCREVLEQRLYSSVRVFEEYLGQRVKKVFADGVVHHGTIRCGRKDASNRDLLTVRFFYLFILTFRCLVVCKLPWF